MQTNGHVASGSIAFHHDPWGKLVLTDALGREHVGVEPVRAFPISNPREGVAVCDAEGREVLWIDALDALPPEQLQLLEHELARRQFLPTIRRIVSVSANGEPSQWHVETDRGSTRFTLQSEEDVRPLANHRAMIFDAHGVRYLIADVRAVDAASRRVLERYL